MYTVQLVMCVFFIAIFGNDYPVTCIIYLFMLLGLNAWLAYAWGQVSSVAGRCLAPLVAWLTCASYITVGRYLLN